MDSEALPGGRIEVIDGLIESVTGNSKTHTTKKSTSTKSRQTLAMPGLINLHSHLDYSLLKNLNVDSPLLPWIQKLLEASSEFCLDDFKQSALIGAKQAALSGTTFICDSSYSGMSASALAQVGLKGLVGLELFGLDSNRAPEVFAHWLSRLESLEKTADEQLLKALSMRSISFTVSPHAPYTVEPRLWKMAVDWAQQAQKPVLAHLSESDSECDWLATSSKTLDAFLKAVMPGDKKALASLIANLPFKGKGLSPVAHLESFGLLTSHLIAAHLCKTSDHDLSLLVKNDTCMAHCPRSNSRLQNGIAPLKKVFQNGLKVGLGTDSLASCDNLSLLDEARFAFELHGDLKTGNEHPFKAYLEMITISAARALRLDKSIGSLSCGKAADIVTIDLDGDFDNETDLLTALAKGNGRIRSVYAQGRQIVEMGCLNSFPEKLAKS